MAHGLVIVHESVDVMKVQAMTCVKSSGDNSYWGWGVGMGLQRQYPVLFLTDNELCSHCCSLCPPAHPPVITVSNTVQSNFPSWHTCSRPALSVCPTGCVRLSSTGNETSMILVIYFPYLKLFSLFKIFFNTIDTKYYISFGCTA